MKKSQMRTKKFLKEYKNDISEVAYDFLMKLATLKEESYDDRATLSIGCADHGDGDKEYYFDFNISVNNLKNAIYNKLSSKVVSKKFGFKLQKAIGLHDPDARSEKTFYSCDGHGFGTTTQILLSCYGPDKEEFFAIFNYVAETLNDIADDILNFEDNYKDREAVKQRQDRLKKEQEK